MIVWSLRDWERQRLDRAEIEALLKARGHYVSGWVNNTPRLVNGTLLDAQRIIEESLQEKQHVPNEEPPKKRRKR